MVKNVLSLLLCSISWLEAHAKDVIVKWYLNRRIEENKDNKIGELKNTRKL